MSETIRFLRGAVRKPQAARAFEDLVLQAPFITGEVIYGFPLNGAPGEGNLRRRRRPRIPPGTGHRHRLGGDRPSGRLPEPAGPGLHRRRPEAPGPDLPHEPPHPQDPGPDRQLRTLGIAESDLADPEHPPPQPGNPGLRPRRVPGRTPGGSHPGPGAGRHPLRQLGLRVLVEPNLPLPAQGRILTGMVRIRARNRREVKP